MKKSHIPNVLCKVKHFFFFNTDERTRAGPAIKFMKSFGLKLAIDNEALITRLGMDKVNLGVPDQVRI
jgi:hypothetical protein